ncbi:amidohydrolase family protein [Streptomyces sp. NPDC002143]
MSDTIATLFLGARLILGDGTPAIENGAILVRNGQILEIGTSCDFDAVDTALRIDLSGKTIMPTIVNPHGHIGYLKDGVTHASNFSRKNVLDHLRRLSYYGVSVYQSLGTDRNDEELSIRNQQRDGTLYEPELAMLMSAANGLAAPTPGESNGGPFFAPDVIREVSTADEARKLVQEISAKKPDIIKFWVDSRNGTKEKLSPGIYSAIIDEAHSSGLLAVAHIYELDDAKGVVRAGADGIAHMVRNPGPDQELLDLLVANDVFVFTSLSIQKSLSEGPGWLDDPFLLETVRPEHTLPARQTMASLSDDVRLELQENYAILKNSLPAYLEAGVRVLMSSDSGVMHQFLGFSEHRELEAMVHAGMPESAAISAATLRPAEMLALADRGSLCAGKRADLLVLNANPLEDISNTQEIFSVYIAGKEIDRASLRSHWT